MESQLDLGKGFLWEKFQPSGGDADGSQVMDGAASGGGEKKSEWREFQEDRLWKRGEDTEAWRGDRW